MNPTVLASLFLAQDAAGAAPGGLLGNPMVFPILMIVVMYFLLIRPQRKRQQEQEALQRAAKPGDQVITIGGMHGTITSVKEKTVMIRIADNVKCEFDKSAIVTFVKRSEEPAAATDAKA